MNFEHLLQSLESSHGPCGEDMIFSVEFDQIQEARRFEDPSISQGEWVTEIKEANWSEVIRIGEDVLMNKSKDLRIAAWLTEARGKIDGLGGLAESYDLLGQLCKAFWDQIHPQLEDGDFEQRVGVLDWLVNQTSRWIREMPLTNSAKGRFSLIDQESARTTARNIERDPALAEALGHSALLTLELFDSALKDTPKKHFLEGMRDAEHLKAAMTSLQTVLDQRMGEHAPAFGPTFDALDDLFRFYRRLAGDAVNSSTGVAYPAGSPAIDVHGQPVITSGCVPETNVGPLRSREQAIRQLQEIATFFKRTEPHSPVAYLAEKAAKWGAMSLHEWLRSVVKDDSSLARMEELLGVEDRPPQHSQD